MADDAPAAVTVRSPARRLEIAVIALVPVVLVVVIAWPWEISDLHANDGAAPLAVDVVLVMWSAFALWRAATMKVVLSEVGIGVRNLWRSRSVSWPDVARVQRVTYLRAYRDTGGSYEAPGLVLQDGTTLRMSAFPACWRSRPTIWRGRPNPALELLVTLCAQNQVLTNIAPAPPAP